VIVCLLTDRSRIDPVEQATLAAKAGIDLIQVRERDLDAKPLASLVARVLAAVRGTATRVVVNDRLDVAIACGADGVHLRADSIPPASARSLAPRGFLIGRSVHERGEAIEAAAHSDYLIAGTVFTTPSKPGGSVLLGVDGLQRIASAVDVPVLAIGGVAVESLDPIALAGAAGVAGIGLFCSREGLESITPERRLRFDRLKPGR
jgi:thiamine-phosphate pyrophosphorylase